jgi:broad specificity phosphatase PhoE
MNNRIYLIRHGKPAAAWGEADPDPGLDADGQAQAASVAEALMALPPDERPTCVVSSPLRRCRETAAPLAKALGVDVLIDPALGEVPTPAALSQAERPAWLREAMSGTWAAIRGDLDYESWRRAVAAAVAGRANCAVFSHYVAINGVLSLVSGEDRVVVFRPDHVSCTVLEAAPEALRLVSLGEEAGTRVN